MPSIFINTPLTFKYVNGRTIGVDHFSKEFNTYKEVKKALRDLLRMSDDGQVIVYRKKRGEFGEWFEHWRFVDGKPEIVKGDWM